MKRQEEQGHCDVLKYRTISLFIWFFIYIYMSLCTLFVFLSLCLWDYLFFIQATSSGQKWHSRYLLMVVAFHEIKCGVMYWERSNCMKRQEEQKYCDVSKYLHIFLWIYIYIYLSLSCLSFFCISLSRYWIFSSRTHRSDWEHPPGICCWWCPFYKCNVV
jgi:hypothetical protein